jgi:hypothetical protein
VGRKSDHWKLWLHNEGKGSLAKSPRKYQTNPLDAATAATNHGGCVMDRNQCEKLKTDLWGPDLATRERWVQGSAKSKEHDAMYAHALVAALSECTDQVGSLEYPADQTVNYYKQSVLQRADELMREWLGVGDVKAD